MDFNNSKTKINLENAFIGESKARNKYTFFSKKAKDDGFIQIGKIFEETANNEKEHAEIWFKLLNDNKINFIPFIFMPPLFIDITLVLSLFLIL